MNIQHHASKEAVEGLFQLFLKPAQDAHGRLIWATPEWLKVMLKTAK